MEKKRTKTKGKAAGYNTIATCNAPMHALLKGKRETKNVFE